MVRSDQNPRLESRSACLIRYSADSLHRREILAWCAYGPAVVVFRATYVLRSNVAAFDFHGRGTGIDMQRNPEHRNYSMSMSERVQRAGLDTCSVASFCGRIRTGNWAKPAPATGTRRQFAEESQQISGTACAISRHACTSFRAAAALEILA